MIDNLLYLTSTPFYKNQILSYPMSQDLNLKFPQHVLCLINKQSQEYSTTIQLKNNSSSVIYFYIASTFGKFMKQLTGSRQIAANSSLTLSFLLKSTNMISKNYEWIAIHASYSKTALLAPSNLTYKCMVNLNFSQDFIEDKEIEQIIDAQIDYLIKEANDLISKSFYKQAKHKFQEGFQLMRKQHKTLEGMAFCQWKLKQWQEALRDIQTAMLFHINPKYLLLKAVILNDCYYNQVGWEGEILQESYRLMKELEKNNSNQLGKQLMIQLKSRLEAFHNNPRINRINMLKKMLFEKAVSKFKDCKHLQKHFESKRHFEQQLSQLMFMEQSQSIVTPQQVVDPINYVTIYLSQQIMQNPLILPSGNSCECKSLQIYFNKNGYKDPISRMLIQPQWVFPNNNLQSYIKNHPKLKLWQQYQHDMIYK